MGELGIGAVLRGGGKKKREEDVWVGGGIGGGTDGELGHDGLELGWV